MQVSKQRQRTRAPRSGFSLLELMITVVIVGVLAATAVPAFTNYIRKTKTTEVNGNLKSLFLGAASYYQEERFSQGAVSVGATQASSNCTVASRTPGFTPSRDRQHYDFTQHAEFEALNFTVADMIHYRYVIVSGPGANCGNGPNSVLYTFSAHGDLDGDGELSTFELAVGSDGDNSLYRAPNLYSVDPVE